MKREYGIILSAIAFFMVIVARVPTAEAYTGDSYFVSSGLSAAQSSYTPGTNIIAGDYVFDDFAAPITVSPGQTVEVQLHISSPYLVYAAYQYGGWAYTSINGSPQGESIDTTHGAIILTAPSSGPITFTGIAFEESDGYYSLNSVGTYYAAPSVPANLSDSHLSGTSFTLSWSASTNASSYEIFENGSSSPIASNLSSTSYDVTGLTPGSTNTFTVEAIGGGGNSAQSASLSVTQPNTPGVPIGLTASPLDQGVALTWSATTNATSYDLERNGVTIATGLTSTTYKDTGLTNGTSYSYAVRADNTAGSSAWSSTVSVMPQVPQPAPAPTNLSLVSGKLNWRPGANTPTDATYTVFENGKAVGTTTNTSYPITNPDSAAVFGVQASAPGYAPSTISSYSETGISKLNAGFTATDLFQNGMLLIASIAGFLLLSLSFVYAPIFVRLIRSTFRSNARERESTKPDSTLLNPISQVEGYRAKAAATIPREELSYHDKPYFTDKE